MNDGEAYQQHMHMIIDVGRRVEECYRQMINFTTYLRKGRQSGKRREGVMHNG